MSHRRPLKLRELLKRLKPFSIVVMPSHGTAKRGKGSEIILLKPDHPGSRKGPQYPVKNHGMGTEISKPVIAAILRRFGIDEDDFWK